jgi:O-succinylbenzoic acid--CoA ligase
MDTALLSDPAFWDDPTPYAFGRAEGLPDLPELNHHVLFETSGSSGVPKLIALSKSALLVSAHAVNAHLQVTTASHWGLALPVHHVGGFGVIARAHAAECGCFRFADSSHRWDAVLFHRWLTEHAISHTSLVPTQVHDLVAARLQAPDCLKAIVVGGGRLSNETGLAARELGWPVLASYGMTEAGSQIATQALSDLQLPYQSSPISLLPIWQAKVSDARTLCIRGPALFSGMLVGRKSLNFIPRSSPWYETSDQVSLENHQLTPLGRADTRVKVLGELIDPEAIEREIIEMSVGMIPPGSLVIAAVPDPRMENALLPVIDPTIDSVVIQQLIDQYNSTCLGHLRLRRAICLNPFPRSELGKPMRAEIAKRIANHSS